MTIAAIRGRQRSAYQPSRTLRRLPAPGPAELTSFVGRQRELSELSQRVGLGGPDSWLVTLVGPGGVGKTRLAREFALGRLPSTYADVVVVELEPLVTPDLVLSAVASGFGVREEPPEPMVDVNNVSMMALAPLPVTPAYAVSKAAAFNLTQSPRALLTPSGIRVHAVLTGPTDTDMTRGFPIQKATIKLVSAYAGVEAQRNSLGIRFVSLLSQMTPRTDLGAPFVAAHAHSSGLSGGCREFVKRRCPPRNVPARPKAVLQRPPEREPRVATRSPPRIGPRPTSAARAQSSLSVDKWCNQSR